MTLQTWNLSTSRMEFLLESAEGMPPGIHPMGLRLRSLTADGRGWFDAALPQSLFSVTVDGEWFDAANMEFVKAHDERAPQGIRHTVFAFSRGPARVDFHIKVYADTALIECMPVITNAGARPMRVERVDSLALALTGAARGAEVFSFTGNWGSEYEPHHDPLAAMTLQSRSGRSSKGNHPWVALSAPEMPVLSAAVAWSGNWAMRFEPLLERAGWLFTAGLNDWKFWKDLNPGESLEGAPVVLALGGDLNDVSQQYARVGRKFWYPRAPLSASLPVEWNHWWPYEDVEINEEVFRRNAAEAERMGFEVCTLDAGWFGPADEGTFWEHYRGDWHLVNTRRFPSGLRALGEFVHARGMKFGIWCEIEGLGIHAQVAKDHPEYVALRGGERIGCVCFGSPAVQEWAYQTLARLITEYGADWIKVDSNFDPGAGCDRTDHGHGAGDGLYAHMRGYYRTLERIRRDFPHVVLENCSSGGLRIDLGMLRRTDMTYLSDPDWPVHDLQIFWGASTMLAPDTLLHWPFGDWRNTNPPPQQNFNPHDANLTQKKWDYYTRIAMLGCFGLSQKLPDLPAWMARRVAQHNAIYQKHVRRFVKEADLYRLTSQPRRSGAGDRWAAFQYLMPGGGESLLFVFRMPGAEGERAVRLQALDAGAEYTVRGLEGEFETRMTGSALMEQGIPFTALEEEDSALLLVERA